MKSTDCVEVPKGLLDHWLASAKLALENEVEVDTHLVRESVTGESTPEQQLSARVAAYVVSDYLGSIVTDLERFIYGAEQ